MGELVDTFPAFLAWWAQARHRPIDDQIEGWATGYMARWPELLARQIEDYAAQDLDWRQVAREKVFPYLADRLPAMDEAHHNLLDLGLPVYSKAQQALAFDGNAILILYVGIGCGAGWATSFRGLPAILFGLEAIAGCGWSGPAAIAGLIAHETAHLVHHHRRLQGGKPAGSGPWWQLYEEGFAQYCAGLILGQQAWHQMSGDESWLDWCRRHKAWLAAEFLRMADAGDPVSPFFGSWFEICGRSETGYFLGHEVMKELRKRFSLDEIALLENVESCCRPVLEQICNRKE